MLGRRLLVAAVAAPVVLLLVYVGGWAFTLLLVVVAVLAASELQALARSARLDTCAPLVYLVAPLLVLDAQWPELGLGWLALAVLALGGLIWALYQPVEPAAAIGGWAVTVATSLYLGLPLRSALLLRNVEDATAPALWSLDLPRGALWLVLVLSLTWACDSAAFFVGRSLGRRPLSPRISPRKTVEGTVAGVLAAGVVGVILGPFLGLPLMAGLGVGLVGGVAAVFGDLAESLLKRSGHAKDSGGLFPGHGGMLDRLDSLLFVVVVVYYCEGLARLLL